MALPNVRGFLIDQGLIEASTLPSASGEFRIECVDCHNPKNKLYINALGKGVSCKHCGMRQSWRVFVRRYTPPTPQELAVEKFISSAQTELQYHPDALKYLRDRGLEDATIEALRFGYCPAYTPTKVDQEVGLADEFGTWVLQDRIIIPYLDGTLIYNVRGRIDPAKDSGQPKYRGLAGTEALPYMPLPVDPEKPVIVTEGEFDAAIVAQNGLQSVGLPGATTAKQEWFSDTHHLYLAFDGDEAGREGRNSLVKKLPEARVIELPEGTDCSDYINNFTFASFEELIRKATLYVHGRKQKDDRFSAVVDDFSAWAFSNGALLGPKISWAPRLEKTLSGWAPGLILLGAEANGGKSCWLVKSCYHAAIDNPDDTISVYLSLDDTAEEAMSRMVSLHSQTHFEIVRSPRVRLAHAPTAMEDLMKSFDTLKQIPNLILRDATYGRSLKYIQSYISNLRMKYPDKKIVVFIDSLAKITPELDKGPEEDIQASTGKTSWKSYLASELKYLTTTQKVCIVTPTDLRKLNDDRRPTRDDLKDASELAYEANVVLLAYNDVNRRRDRALLTWTYMAETHPIFEVIVDKNKITTEKPVIRYEMYGPHSDFSELTQAEDDEWYRKIREDREKRKEAFASGTFRRTTS